MTLHRYLETHDSAEREAKKAVWSQAVDILGNADLGSVRVHVEAESRLSKPA